MSEAATADTMVDLVALAYAGMPSVARGIVVGIVANRIAKDKPVVLRSWRNMNGEYVIWQPQTGKGRALTSPWYERVGSKP
jgi:hypothetical protein